eukprot:scaffold40799_cov31-Cyclotella_meneghiniana.AAC.3
MSSRGEVHVGSPPDGFTDGEIVTIHFHDFANLSVKRGQWVESPTFSLVGYKWQLRMFPRGAASSRQGMVAVFLHNESNSKVVASYEITLRKSGGGAYKTTTGGGTERCFDPDTTQNKWGRPNFVSRKEILFSKKILNNGALTFIVRIKPSEEYYCETDNGPIEQQTSSIGDNIFNNLFNDKDSADVAFDVMGVLFYAHKAILKAQSPEFHEFTMPFSIEMSMPIDDIEPVVFELMLKYVYGKSVLDQEWRDHSKTILDASGKYGLSALESEAVAWREENLDLTESASSSSEESASDDDDASQASAGAWFPPNDPPGELHSDEMHSDELHPVEELHSDEIPSDDELLNANNVAYC